MNKTDLSGKTAVVTGGGGVLGSRFCKALAGAGAARAEINEKFGTCDILVNGAGGNNSSASTDDEYLNLDKLDDPNVKNFFALDTDSIDFVFKFNFIGTLIPSQMFWREFF